MSKIDEIEKRVNAAEDITIEPDGMGRAMTPAEIAAREADEAKAREKVAAEGRKPILCLDFDGVIHSYSSGWKGADVIPDPPVEGAIAFMLGALNHFKVVIFSSRSHQRGGTAAMQRRLREHAGAAWYESPAGPGLEDVQFAAEKPAAMITLDDRALTFDGTWPDLDDLKNFQPWNKRPKLGATGEFPEGSLGPHDEGALKMGVAHDSKGNVHRNFGKEISWFAVPPEQAIELGKLLMRHAGAKKIEVPL